MKFDPEKYHRRSIRLNGYDYREAGYYFITICVENRLCLFGEIKNDEMVLNDLGKIVEEEWKNTEKIRPNVELDEFVVMPNHVHGIVVIKYKMEIDVGRRGVLQYAPTDGELPNDVGEYHEGVLQYAPTDGELPNDVGEYHEGVLQYAPAPLRSPSQTIGSIVRGFKSAATKRVNVFRDTPGSPVWQRNYFENIIHEEEDYNNIRRYIVLNPSMWDRDRNDLDGFH